MSKLYDDIFDEVNNHFDTPHVVLKKVKSIKDIAIKAQIELLEVVLKLPDHQKDDYIRLKIEDLQK